MAKSLRSKSKRSFRSKKRESGKYAAAEAARLNRLSARLATIKRENRPIVAPLDTAMAMEMTEGDQLEVCDPGEPGTAFSVQEGGGGGWVNSNEKHSFWEQLLMYTQILGAVSDAIENGEGMALDEQERSDERSIPVSTHGPRGSRREEWRKSNGMDPIPKRRGMNRQGGLAARRKAGRPSRRR